MSFRSSVVLDKMRGHIDDEKFEESISEKESELLSDAEAAENGGFEVKDGLECWNKKNAEVVGGRKQVFTYDSRLERRVS